MVRLVQAIFFSAQPLIYLFTVSVIFALALAIPGQTIESYRILAGNAVWTGQYVRPATAILSILLAAWLIFGASQAVLGVVARQTGDVFPYRDLFPSLLGFLPLLGLIAGLLSASDLLRQENTLKQIEDIAALDKDHADHIIGLLDYHSNSVFLLEYVAGATAVLCAVLLVLGLKSCRFRRAMRMKWMERIIESPFLSFAVAAIILVLVLSFVLYPVSLSQTMGVFSIFSIFLVCLSLVLARLVVLSIKWRVPLVFILLLAAVLFSVFDRNDNHELARVDSSRARPSGAGEPFGTVKEAFAEWLAERKDRGRPRYDRQPYPVYVVAAQGGGAYAAAQAHLFLTKAQGSCEHFAQHLFAISGVSGGSVGAAFFSASAARYENKAELHCPALGEPQGDKGLEPYVQALALLRSDFLSPVLGGLLFPDFFQRFVPFEIRALSRARALEEAFAQEWERAVGATKEENPMRKGVLTSWTPDGMRPMLFFNTTETRSGRRRLIAPARLSDDGGDLRMFPLTLESDVSIVSAATASARFPWVTPAAWFTEDDDKVRIVDGGYFENSGVATALQIIREIGEVARGDNVEIHLIVFTSESASKESFLGLGELLGPIRGLLNARRAQSATIINLAQRRLGSYSAELEGKTYRIDRLLRAPLEDEIGALPLGWRLSAASVFQIDRTTGQSSHCERSPRFSQQIELPTYSNADCVRELVHRQLRGELRAPGAPPG